MWRYGLIVCLALLALPVWAHPHGSASCFANVQFSGNSVSQVEVTLELDADHSRAAFAEMQTAADGTFSQEQATRLANNLHQLFAPLNYLVTIKNTGGKETKEIGLRPTAAPSISRTAQARLRLTAQLARSSPTQADESENMLSVNCSDPSWNWLVGFKEAEPNSSTRQCKTALGRAYVFFMSSFIPKTDAPSIKVTAENMPKSQELVLQCS